jgi:hypothetical protein
MITVLTPRGDAKNRQCEVLLNRVLRLANIMDAESYSLQRGIRIVESRQLLFIDGNTMVVAAFSMCH